MSIELQSDFLKGKSVNIAFYELTDCASSDVNNGCFNTFNGKDLKVNKACKPLNDKGHKSDLSKGKSVNISFDELTDCTRSVDAKISRAGQG
ncbi:long chain acyl-CoA synthetase 1-like [Dorcoceras hygrometricum]|uniref:Long chain acyl-CoA synthetase 1-like n=1 Tax=Dorcoceras hygrometricum TaxID=472368 RepID=A0A2Z7DAM3_9LAMI|nr:long chain acyl-CoA synthetase 1-like [Dorcoceras hygrometricum]